MFLLTSKNKYKQSQCDSSHHTNPYFIRFTTIQNIFKSKPLISISMQGLRNKTKQIQQKFRREQIEDYKKQIRKEIINSTMEEKPTAELNAITAKLIGQANLEELYNTLFRKKIGSSVPIAHLNRQIIFQLLNFLLQNMKPIESLLLMGNIFDIHYQMVFNDPNNRQTANFVVRMLYEHINFCVKKYQEQNNDSSLQKYVNAGLSCLKSLIFNKDQPNSEGQLFTQFLRQDYLLIFFQWRFALSTNLHYLVILLLIEIDVQLSAFPPVKLILNSDAKFMRTLLGQCDPQFLKHKACAVPAVNIANEFIRNITNKTVLQELVTPFLETSKVLHSYSLKNQQKYYKIQNFLDTLKNIIYIFDILEQAPLHKHLCEILSDSSYWIFVGILLRCEAFQVRYLLFEIIRLAVNNLLYSKGNLQEYLTEQIISLLGEGLQSQNNEIITSNLEIFIKIITYCRNHEEKTQHIMKYINDYDINTGLQNLQGSMNVKIRQMSTVLAQEKARLESKDNDMVGEL